MTVDLGEPTHTLVLSWMPKPVEVNQPVHWFLGGKGLGIYLNLCLQGTSVRVVLPQLMKVGHHILSTHLPY